jgi:hypothetical protein
VGDAFPSNTADPDAFPRADRLDGPGELREFAQPRREAADG